jgi:hypothetical protein
MNPDKVEPCYLVLRDDGGAGGLTVKLVVWTPEEAEAEIERLKKLNPMPKCAYTWVKSRALRRSNAGQEKTDAP